VRLSSLLDRSSILLAIVVAMLKTPTLAVVGTSDDPDIRTIVDGTAAQAPHARGLVMAGAGHMLNMERPAEILKAIREFLAQAANNEAR
jgi:pimeloyl-ACP methyl ester carboxylesterase